jgi:predicted DsbA family dithiol-disulfide isomerase
MRNVQVFFDYECPYCKKGYEYLCALLNPHKQGDGGYAVEWRPIESHPRPENHPPHTDLACQGYYAAKELGADMPKFFAAMFQAVAVERRNVEQADVLCGVLKGIVDTDKFRALIESGKYAKQVDENNDLAYEKSGVWFVPAFRMETADGSVEKLDAEGGKGISPEGLKAFLNVKA